MQRFYPVYIAGFAILVLAGSAPSASTDGPYHLVKTVKVGGAGTFDTACADASLLSVRSRAPSVPLARN